MNETYFVVIISLIILVIINFILPKLIRRLIQKVFSGKLHHNEEESSANLASNIIRERYSKRNTFSSILPTENLRSHTEIKTYDSCKLEDLRSQGFLLGDEVSKAEYPPFVFKILDNDPSINLLSGKQHGVVMVFYDDKLTIGEIIEQLKTNRSHYIKKLGIDPRSFSPNIKLVEVDLRRGDFTLYKPTPKDGGFGPFFRYNNTKEPYGRSLDLNSGSTDTGVRQYAMKNYQLSHEEIVEHSLVSTMVL